MRRFKRLLSCFLTLALALAMTDLPALGMFVTLSGDWVSISAGEGEKGFAASYDGDGRMLDVGERVTLGDEAQSVRVMVLDGESLAPRSAALSAQQQDWMNADLSVPAGATLVLEHTRNADHSVNGAHVGNAHVFGYDMPYGIFTGMERDVFEETVTDFAVYPGRRNNETGEPEFSDTPAFRMEDTTQYKYNYNDYNGVNIFPKAENLIDDPYQVRFALTLTGDVTVIYDTLWYKEGQITVCDFAAEVRRRAGEALGAVNDDDRAAVGGVWDENEYNDRLDDFAFAVKHGELLRPTEENDWNTDARHVWNAWDDLRYGTAKTILESVYRAAWNDEAHTVLPDSVKLTDEWGNEWHSDEDGFPRREADQMLDAFEDALPPLPQRETVASTITVKRSEDGWCYVLFDGAADTEENRQDANLKDLRFTNAVTVTADDTARDGWLGLRNCAFDGGLTVEAPALAKDENEAYYGRLTLNFHDSCTGAVTVTEAAEDAAARQALVGALSPELTWELEEHLFYWDAVGLERADGMTVTTGDARVGVNMNGGTVTMNGVTFASDAHYWVNANYDLNWVWDEDAEDVRLADSSVRLNARGSNYDSWDETSLDHALTLTGSAASDLHLRGIVDVSGLSMGEKRLYADFDRHDWSNAYLTLTSGQEVYVFDNSFDLELWVNGAWVRSPVAREENGDVRIDVPDGFDATVWQRRDDAMPEITDELRKDEHDGGATYGNPENGWDEENERWNPLNEDSVYGTRVRLERDGVAVIYDPVPREWERPVNLGEFGENLLSFLNESDRGALELGGYAAEDYFADENEELDAAAVECLERVWTDRSFDNWADPRWRSRIAFTLALLPDGIAERYGDPSDAIRWGDAKAALTAVLTALGKNAEEVSFRDGGWQDDYELNQGGRDDLFAQLIDRLPPLDVAGDCEIMLNRREDHFTYCTVNGQFVESNEIIARRFTGSVTVSYGKNAAEDDNWGGDLSFRNCVFEGGLTIRADDAMDYAVDFANGCSGAVTVETSDYRRVELRGLGGMTVQADNGVALDATAVEDELSLGLSRYEFSAGGDERINYATAVDWGGCMVALRLNDDFLHGEALTVALDGAAIPFVCEESWDNNEYVLLLRGQDGSPWIDRDSLDRLAVSLSLGGAALTFTPAPEWERPARIGDLVDNLLGLLRQREIDREALRGDYAEQWDDSLRYGEALDILGGEWQSLRPGEDAALGLDDVADDAILTLEQLSELVWEQFQNRALDGEYAGDSAQALQALLNSGRGAVTLTGDTTLSGDLTVPQEVDLIVSDTAALTVAGTVTVNGALVNIGTVTGAGSLVIGEDGYYVNELTMDNIEGVLDLTAAQLVNKGTVVCFVPEQAGGELTSQPIFAEISGQVDYRAVVKTKNGFDNAHNKGYNGCIIIDNGDIVATGEIGFERLVIYDGAALTLAGGTLTLSSLELRGGALLVGQDAALTLNGESRSDGSLTVSGAMQLNGAFQNEFGGRFTVSGVVTVEQSAELVNDGTLTLEGDGRIDGSWIDHSGEPGAAEP